MMIVLLIISILILIAIPNVTKNSAAIDEKGCDAYVKMVQGQVEAYKLDNDAYPSDLKDLVDNGGSDGYFSETPQCPDGRSLQIVNGKVGLID